MTLTETARNLAADMDKWRRAGLPIVTPEQRAERLEGIAKPVIRCIKRPMQEVRLFHGAKTWLGTAACPIGKWPALVDVDSPSLNGSSDPGSGNGAPIRAGAVAWDSVLGQDRRAGRSAG